ncbi:esterase-like activity of phytase family protein [Martelella sp. HB161492]|uniref:esterase-like activity of phytase family protein n=1 Tax=Martelella sp. HB161492 TaxID=2720726 RepID=UPI001591D951|nr:esterase-like activity of phytase family protein [Martelella sp. HB161492]
MIGRFVLCLGFAVAVAAAPALSGPVPVAATPIPHFALEGSETQFGRLTYLGGLKLASPNAAFQSLSAIRFRPDGQHFIAVADNGTWITGAITRSADGRLSGIRDVTISPMKNRKGVHAGKSAMDSESLAIDGDQLLVGFEGEHRIDRYPLKGFETATAKPGPNFLVPRKELRRNGSFEALAADGKGRVITVTEQSVDADGHLFAAIIEGPDKGIFKVVKTNGFDVTDAVFLPGGDVLLLERRFSLLAGIDMRIRRIDGAAIRPGALVDGPVIMQASGRETHIDNMEGMDLIRRPDGSLSLILVSDDNASPFQSTLMLEFALER